MIVELLKKVYHRLSHIPLVSWLGRRYLDGFPLGNALALRRLRKTARRRPGPPDRKIRVAFMAQSVQDWGKIAPVYDVLRTDAGFESLLLAFQDISDPDGQNKTFLQMKERYPETVPVSLTPSEAENRLLEDFRPDYVFCTRSYDQYLPPAFQSMRIAAYAKVCYCSYCFFASIETITEVFSKLFARNVSIFYAETPLDAEYNRKRFVRGHREGTMKTLLLGYPIMARIAAARRNDDPLFHVLWTPRWSTAAETYGTSFFKYKDRIVDFALREPGLRLTFRPHPLLFYHNLQTGELTQEQIDAYLAVYQREDRLRCDTGAEYLQTMADADVLVSDISSMVAEYFVTGKPIIFCDTGGVVSGVYQHLLEGVYIVRTWEEVEETVQMLRRGEDPKAERRLAIRDEVFLSHLDRIPARFLQSLREDFAAWTSGPDRKEKAP